MTQLTEPQLTDLEQALEDHYGNLPAIAPVEVSAGELRALLAAARNEARLRELLGQVLTFTMDIEDAADIVAGENNHLAGQLIKAADTLHSIARAALAETQP